MNSYELITNRNGTFSEIPYWTYKMQILRPINGHWVFYDMFTSIYLPVRNESD